MMILEWADFFIWINMKDRLNIRHFQDLSITKQSLAAGGRPGVCNMWECIDPTSRMIPVTHFFVSRIMVPSLGG